MPDAKTDAELLAVTVKCPCGAEHAFPATEISISAHEEPCLRDLRVTRRNRTHFPVSRSAHALLEGHQIVVVGARQGLTWRGYAD